MIRRVIRLVLDRAAANRVEKDTQRSLEKGTDSKKAEQNLGRVRRSMDGLRSMALRLGTALAGLFAVHKIQQFGREAVRVASEARAVWNRLAGQLRVAGVEFSDVEGDIRGAARALQDVTTVGDEDFAAIMTELLGTTNDYTASLAEVETVANLAAAKQIDLRTAAQLVGRAMVGQTGTLSRYGIIVEEGADAMEVLRARFAGMARNEALEIEGRVAQLSNEWADFKEAVGQAMIAAGGGTSILETLIGTVKGATIWVDENRESIAFWGSLTIDVMKAVGQTAAGIFNLVRSVFGFAAAEIVRITRQAQLDLARIANAAATGVNAIIEGLNHLPGVDIDFRMAGQPIEEFEAMRDAAAADLKAELGGITDALVQVGQGWVDVGNKALFAERSQESATAAAPGAEPGGGGGPSGPGKRDITTSDAVDFVGDNSQRIAGAVGQVATDIRRELDANNPFAGLIEQVDVTAAYMREGFAGVGRAIVAQLVEGRAQEQFAAGLAALASGTWPPNPAALAAAGKHFAAAAAFKAIGATFGGAAGAGGLAVAGGGRLPPGAIGTSSPASRELPSAEVHIYLDPLSPADPRFQRVVLGAEQNAKERFGNNVRVNVHPRSGSGL